MSEEMKAGLRVALYARVSSEEQRKGQTIRSQIGELKDFAKAKEWRIVEVFSDDGWSGALLNRPQLDRLRDDAKAARFDAVLINDVDRLARDVAHIAVIKRDLERQDVQLIFRKLPSRRDPTYNLLVNILASFAEFEKELITDRMRRGKRYKVEVARQFVGGRAPYGYSYGPTKKERGGRSQGKLSVNPDEAAVVRRIYRWVDGEGLSIRRIASRLGKRGVPTRTGSKWRFSTVQRILRRETYAGVWYYNRHEVCEPKRPRKRLYQSNKAQRLRPREQWIRLDLPKDLRIIDRDLWERVQARLDSNSTFSPRNAHHNYLLKSLVRCGGCFSTYVGSKNRTGSTYYRCYRACKRFPNVHEQVLDKVVMKAVLEALLRPKHMEGQLKRLRQAEWKAQDGLRDEQSQLHEGLKRLDREEKRMIEAYRTGVVTHSQLRTELEGIKARRRELEKDLTGIARRESAEAVSQPDDPVFAFCANVAKGLKTAKKTTKQHLLWQVVDQIVFRGSEATIEFRIPIPPETADPSGSIATPSTCQRVRNPALEFALTKPIPVTTLNRR